jgi:hypothetical protein
VSTEGTEPLQKRCTKVVQIVFEMCMNAMKTRQNTRTEANGQKRYCIDKPMAY